MVDGKELENEMVAIAVEEKGRYCSSCHHRVMEKRMERPSK